MDVERRERERTKGTREEDALTCLEQRVRETKVLDLLLEESEATRFTPLLFPTRIGLAFYGYVSSTNASCALANVAMSLERARVLYINCKIFHSDTETLLKILILLLNITRNNLDRKSGIEIPIVFIRTS